MSAEQFGTDRTFPSPTLLNCRPLIVGRVKSCSRLPSLRLVCAWWDRLLADPVVHHEEVGWPYLSGRGQCTVLGLPCPRPARRGGWTGALYHTLCTGLSTAALGSCCMPGRSCTASMCPWAKLSFPASVWFPIFLAHFTDLQFNLQALSHAQLSLQKCGAYRSSV